MNLGFHRCKAGYCAFIHDCGNGGFIILLLYVYDMLVGRTSKGNIATLKAQLTREFDKKDLETVNQILGNWDDSTKRKKEHES